MYEYIYEYIHLRAISQYIRMELMLNTFLNIAYFTFKSLPYVQENNALTHWVTHVFVGNLTIIGSDNGLTPGRRQAIT